MKTILLYICLAVIAVTSSSYSFGNLNKHKKNKRHSLFQIPINAGLKLPPGFSATIVADKLGRARHIAITKNGIIYVKLEKLKNGKGIIKLSNINADEKAMQQSGFGNYTGTGICIKGNYLYASSDEDVYRYTLNDKSEVINPDKPEKIISGLLNRHEHPSKSIVLDNNGNVYVNIGAYSNSCQVLDRTIGSPGQNPCPILDSAGGIWQFKADKLNQHYADGVRYATGLRNVVGLDWNNTSNELFVLQHGRDQLSQLFPDLYNEKQNAELPAEAMYELHKGDNAGWPYIYYDQLQKKKILSPEYGGDGKKTAGEDAVDPVMAFPGHLGPNGLLFYTGKMFPVKYKDGAFITFHGSWNRAPEKQKGFNVVFVPFKNGKPVGTWEIFADNFAGTENIYSPKQAKHRPCGIAQGPDGALYISDDVQGTVYRISYNGKE